MKLENERKCDDVSFDVDLNPEEFETFLKYGKENITDDALVSFAMRDILIKHVERGNLLIKAKTVVDVLENAAELGCPSDKEVDMWFRELTYDEQCDVMKHAEEIRAERY